MGILAKIETWFQGKKTYLLVISGVIAAVVGYLEHTLTLNQMIAAIWASLTAGSLRSGIAKSGTGNGGS